MYRGAALHGADGEAEGGEVNEQDGGQHRGGAGHGVRSARWRRGQRKRWGKGFWLVPGFQMCEARLVAGALASWLSSRDGTNVEEGVHARIWSGGGSACRAVSTQEFFYPFSLENAHTPQS